MAKVLGSEENLTNIANAIREKNGETTTYKPGDMAGAIQNISSGGSTITKGIIVNEYDEDGYPIDVSLTGFTTIPAGYLQCSNSYSGGYLAKINKINLPDGITHIDDSAFQESRVNIINIPSNVTRIGYQSFMGTQQLTSIDLPKNLIQLGDEAFSTSGITSLIIPSKIKNIEKLLCSRCEKLTKVICEGNITSIIGSDWNGSFDNCTSLTVFELPNVTSVPTLTGQYAFKNGPIENRTGYIYVPDDLVESFKSATN